MDPSRFQQIKKLFAEARELDESKRAAFLTDACGTDAELRTELDELLESDRQVEGGFLSKALSHEPLPSATPETIGNYRLRKLIGEGGMGEVYLADQDKPIRREVALKIIRPGLENKAVLGRFESERQAIAMMDHRNIARALDAGSMEDGRPYFVMEYVDGVPITDYCDQNRLSTVERLELLAQVCDGLQHAHQKAIIHRDIKPSNVLVTLQDGQPTPKIIDFGIAKAAAQPLTEQTMFTELGQVIGTPEYMSPEQAQLTGDNVDTRTDIYSLGVLMYEVLVGVLPFDPEDLRRAGFQELLRRIREEDPPRPSTRFGTLGDASAETIKCRKTTAHRLSSELRGDLDWITMKALEKDPARRYGSATELAEDIRHYLKFEPVSAGPPGAAYRISKFVRRHRIGVGFATVAVLFAATFLITTLAQAELIAAERDRANEEAQGAREIANFLTDLFRRADPGHAKGENVTAREILDTGAREIERLDDKPLTQAAFMETIGEVYGIIGLFEEGQKLLEGALEIRQRTGTGTESSELALAGALLELGSLHMRGGHFDLGLPMAERSAEIYERLLGDSARLAMSLTAVGNGLQQTGRFPESEAMHRRALAIREKLGDTSEAGIGKSLHNVGSLRFLQDDLEEAAKYYLRAIEVCEASEGKMSYSLGTTMHTLAMVYSVQGRYAEARPLEERSLAIREHVLGPEHPHVALSLRTLSEILTKVGEAESAEPMAARAVIIGQESWGEDVPDVWWMQRGHSEVLNALGRHEEALAIMKPLVDYVEKAPRKVEIELHWAELGECYRGLKRQGEARSAYEKALEYSLELNGEDSAYTAETRLGLARVLAESGSAGEARALYESALKVLLEKRGEKDPAYVRGRRELQAIR